MVGGAYWKRIIFIGSWITMVLYFYEYANTVDLDKPPSHLGINGFNKDFNKGLTFSTLSSSV